MSTTVSITFLNHNPMPLLLESQRIDGASWTKPIPKELKPGKTDDGYGVASTDSDFFGHFTYVVEGGHVLDVAIRGTEAGEVKVECTQSAPFQVAPESQKHGDTWVVTLLYSGPF